MHRHRIVAAIVLVLIALGGWDAWRMRASDLSRQSGPASDPSFDPVEDITKFSHFNAPGLTQAEIGAKVYVDWCESCHADTGLGLTAAWLAQWDPDHQNCWQAKCHSLDHPSDGFEIPRHVPAVVGEAAFSRFETAADLQAYVQAEMPYAEKGVLDGSAYWALTAYLLNRNGLIQDSAKIGPGNATFTRLTR